MKKYKICDIVSIIGFLFTVILSVYSVLSHISSVDAMGLYTAIAVAILYVTGTFFIYRLRLPVLWLAATGITVVLVACSNNMGYYPNMAYIIQLFVCLICGVCAILFQVKEKLPVKKFPIAAGSLFLAFLLIFCGIWGGNTLAVKVKQGDAELEIWSVPTKYDATPCAEQGRVEKLVYSTKAYATDNRTVNKTAYVYLPYGYKEDTNYNILYLLHGTGDKEDYWLIKNPKNKTMLDNMIYYGDIGPLIVVTPTWYVENDCEDDLDQLTYSFEKELRNDLMVAVESKYSTYAKDTSNQSFIESRDHRAFAGLSRGAVTTWHSVYNKSLDYFSYIGCFSGARTTKEEFLAGSLSNEFSSYPIHYLYNTSGSFDFLLSLHLQTYQELLGLENRLEEGKNVSFDVFPMRYHSQGNWHIALYNALQLFFK